jgi:excisionase family DNA binding protein
MQTITENTRLTLKIHEAAALAGCGQKAIRNGIAAGYIPCLRLGRNLLIPRSAFLRWLDTAGDENRLRAVRKAK